MGLGLVSLELVPVQVPLPVPVSMAGVWLSQLVLEAKMPLVALALVAMVNLAVAANIFEYIESLDSTTYDYIYIPPQNLLDVQQSVWLH